MKFALILSVLAYAGAVSAQTIKLNCMAVYNYGNPLKFNASLDAGERNKLVAELGEHQIFLSSLKNGEVELQTLDLEREIRSYATTGLAASNPLKLSVWKRESLIEISCSLPRR